MLSKNFLSKTLTAVSTVALLGSALLTHSWAMDPHEGGLAHSTPISSVPNLQEEGQNLQQQKVAVKNQKTIGFVQEIFDPRGKIKNFSDDMAREFFENLGCTVHITYPGTDWAGNKRGRTMVSFGTGEDAKKLIYHQGRNNTYTISNSLRVNIREYLIRTNRTPENLIVLEKTVD